MIPKPIQMLKEDDSIAEYERLLADYVDGIRQESYYSLVRFHATIDENLRLFQGDHWDREPAEGLYQYTVNLVSSAVLSSAAIQFDKSPRVIFEATESNEEAIYYFSEVGVAAIQRAMAEGQAEVEGFDSDTLNAMKPMSEDQANQMRVLMQPIMDEMGNVVGDPILSEDDLIKVDDAACASLIELAYEKLYDKANIDKVARQNAINNLIIGWQPVLFEWIPGANEFRWTNMHVKNVFIDPIATGTHDAGYLIFDQVLSADEALEKFPHMGKLINEKANGNQNKVQGAGVTYGSQYENNNYYRDMLVLSTIWIRNANYGPMSEEDALNAGLVELIEDPMDMEPPSQELTDLANDETGVVGKKMGTPDPDEMMPEMPTEEEEPEAIEESQGVQYRLVGTIDNAITTPEADNWPVRLGIRQVQLIDDAVLQDIECPFMNIPVGWNVNIPEPYGPYGQGEPERCGPVQRLINTLFSAIANNADYFQSPQECISASMHALMDNPNTHAHPGQRHVVPDEQYERFGGKITTITPPPAIPTSISNTLESAFAAFDRITDRSEVLRGESNAQDSGKKVALLQEAAKGVVGLKSRGTEELMRYMAQIGAQAMIDFLPESEWVKISSYPIQVLRSLIERLHILEWDVTVEVVSGRGANREADQNKALALYDRMLTSKQTTLESMEVSDAKGELEKQIQEMQQAAPPEQEPEQ